MRIAKFVMKYRTDLATENLREKCKQWIVKLIEMEVSLKSHINPLWVLSRYAQNDMNEVPAWGLMWLIKP